MKPDLFQTYIDFAHAFAARHDAICRCDGARAAERICLSRLAIACLALAEETLNQRGETPCGQ